MYLHTNLSALWCCVLLIVSITVPHDGFASRQRAEAPGRHHAFTPTARVWVDAMLDYLKQKEPARVLRLKKRIEKINEQLATCLSNDKSLRLLAQRGVITDKLAQTSTLYQRVRDEVFTMEASSQVYDFQFTREKVTDGRTIYNVHNDRIVFNILDDLPDFAKMAMFLHEFTHGYQFETGQVSIQIYYFDVNDSVLVTPAEWFLIDFKDEEEIYETRFRQLGIEVMDWHTNYAKDPIILAGRGRPKLQNTIEILQDTASHYLQKLACDNVQAFRVNGKTYAPPLQVIKEYQDGLREERRRKGKVRLTGHAMRQ